MRGVHDTKDNIMREIKGSSPHARGPLYDRILELCYPRIIPACAGSTIRIAENLRKQWDHPRMRGVHYLIFV